jgi:hypothetical protein
MKNAIIVFLLICIGVLYFKNKVLDKQLKRKPVVYYQTNLTREEMKEVLSTVAIDTIALMIPGDTSVMPYLIKSKRPVPREVVRR